MHQPFGDALIAHLCNRILQTWRFQNPTGETPGPQEFAARTGSGAAWLPCRRQTELCATVRLAPTTGRHTLASESATWRATCPGILPRRRARGIGGKTGKQTSLAPHVAAGIATLPRPPVASTAPTTQDGVNGRLARAALAATNGRNGRPAPRAPARGVTRGRAVGTANRGTGRNAAPDPLPPRRKRQRPLAGSAATRMNATPRRIRGSSSLRREMAASAAAAEACATLPRTRPWTCERHGTSRLESRPWAWSRLGRRRCLPLGGGRRSSQRAWRPPHPPVPRSRSQLALPSPAPKSRLSL